MLINFDIIRKRLDVFDIPFSLIIEKLNIGGLEVEKVEQIAHATNLVIGKVISVTKIEDSDHLNYCKVDIGGEMREIVCGASNVEKNKKVIVALPGSELKAKGLVIKETVIRGYNSSGMLCSLRELGVPENYIDESSKHGIEILDDDAPIGENPLVYLDLDDIILDVKTFPNRIDTVSIEGVLREIAAILGLKFTPLPDAHPFLSQTTEIDVDIDYDCANYFSILEVNNVTVKESPYSLKVLLHKWGYSSVNNVVDYANYVTHLTGQPLHIYDADKVDRKMIIRKSRGETFRALNGELYTLSDQDIVITDSNDNILCLGGVIGAENSMIDFNTKNILIEAACFDKDLIRSTSKRLGIATDASSRFSRGINDTRTVNNLLEYVQILEKNRIAKEFYGTLILGKVSNGFRQITFKPTNFSDFLGMEVDIATITEKLNLLNFKHDLIKGNYIVSIPSYRQDIVEKEDIYEELIKLIGFDSIPESFPDFFIPILTPNVRLQRERRVKDYLVSKNFTEILTYSLTSFEISSLVSKENLIKITNPIGVEREYLRTSLIPSIVDALNYNIDRSRGVLNFFELSSVYLENQEKLLLSAVITRNNDTIFEKGEYSFFELKGIVEDILRDYLNAPNLTFISTTNPLFQVGQTAKVLIDNREIGYVGKLNSKLLGLSGFAFEIDISSLSSELDNIIYEEPSRYQSSVRDISVSFSNDVTYQEVLDVINSLHLEQLEKVELFDYYQNRLEEAIYHLAFHLTFVDKHMTLKDSDINMYVNKIVDALKVRLQGNLR